MLLGSPPPALKHLGGIRCACKGLPVKKAIYAITLVLLGALIIQSVWGAEAKPAATAAVRMTASSGPLVINAHPG
jgi:hypothetical protein